MPGRVDVRHSSIVCVRIRTEKGVEGRPLLLDLCVARGLRDALLRDKLFRGVRVRAACAARKCCEEIKPFAGLSPLRSLLFLLLLCGALRIRLIPACRRLLFPHTKLPEHRTGVVYPPVFVRVVPIVFPHAVAVGAVVLRVLAVIRFLESRPRRLRRGRPVAKTGSLLAGGSWALRGARPRAFARDGVVEVGQPVLGIDSLLPGHLDVLWRVRWLSISVPEAGPSSER
mmetsp:Transcript_1186/g.2727  ORF Transcript_1186/g.2727 Transcript_1186/m.2727 type:complete len:228 (+) Transcript_1186:1709-2392(+)